jgi:predicted outer membrane repeat protein
VSGQIAISEGIVSHSNNLRSHSIKYQARQFARPTIAPLAAAIGGALAATSLQAATITVDTLDDGFVAGQCSLRAALYSATANYSFDNCVGGDSGEDLIEFESSLSGTIALEVGAGSYFDGSTLPVGESVTIDGDGRITLQGTGSSPVLYLKYDPDGFTTDSVTVDGLTITGGGGDNGGGIHAQSRELRVLRSTLTANAAVDAGGAIWHQHTGSSISRTSISSSVISGNVTTGASSRGGAVAIAANGHQLDVTLSDIHDNQALGSGGAIDFRATSGLANVTTSNSFYGNTAKYGDGGAINVVSNGGYGVVLNTRDTAFTYNTATGDGGAIAIVDNGTGQNGFGQLRLLGTSFASNVAGGDGGAVGFARGDGVGTVGSPENEVLIDASPYTDAATTFIDNTAAYSAGALDLSVGDATPVLVYDAIFSANQASDGNGGAAVMQVGNAGLAMSEVTIESNLAAGSGQGGGLLVQASNGGNVEGQGLQVIDNQGAYGGGIRIVSNGGDIGFENAQFLDNSATVSFGGGLQVSGTPNQFGIAHSVFSGNSAGTMGGAMDIYAPGSESAFFEIKYSEWSANGASSHGGAMSIVLGDASQVFVENSTLSGNTAGGRGGALYSTFGNSLTLKYSTVAENYAQTEGGGLYTDLANGCEVYNSILAGNTVGQDAEPQDLRGGDYLCDVRDSLIAGKYSEFNAGANNILGEDPLLLPLADNGGTGGRTHALGEGSPAIDAGNAGDFAPSHDQRGPGYDRVFGAGLDMGAFEVQPLVDEIFGDRFESSP